MSALSTLKPAETAKNRTYDGATPLKGDQPAASGGGGFFDTLIDIVNPLQHIPGISTMYQESTGDTISGFADIVGGGLFGGIIGAAASAANEVVVAATGDDVGGHVLSGLEDAASQDTTEDIAPAGTPLMPDNGTAALSIAMLGTTATPAVAPETPTTSPEAVAAVNSLTAYRDPTMGLKEADKQEQYRMQMDKIAIDMKS